jgi:prolyl-tRNA synthetase
VEAATGAIGGTLSHEFHVLAESGEDALVSCNRCEYAANVEKAEVRPPAATSGDACGPTRKVHTPEQRTVEEVGAFLSTPPERFIKTLLYVTDQEETVAALVRGDHELSEAKLLTSLGCSWVEMADAETFEKATGAAVGFAGPVGLELRTVADAALRGISGAVTGANETDYHIVDVDQDRDLSGLAFADLRTAGPGDACARCEEGVYEGHRGIEVGQVFYLGTKYSSAMGATFLDASGQDRPMEMGCYGIGITRTAAAAIEQNHDQDGIIWPLALAPAHVHLIMVNGEDARQREVAEGLYRDLEQAGVEVLFDDREERPGVKFKDADLIGIPLRVTVGPKALKRDAVELRPRREKEVTDLPLAEAVEKLADIVHRDEDS